MAQQFLHGSDVVSVFEEVRRKRVAQRVAAYVLGDAGRARGFFDAPDQVVLIHMMPPDYAGARIDRALVGRKNELPAPLVRRARILARKRVGQLDVAATINEILVVKFFHAQQMRLQWLNDGTRQNSDTVFGALAITNHDLSITEIHILDP